MLVRPATAADARPLQALVRELGYEVAGFEGSLVRLAHANPTRVWVADEAAGEMILGMMSLSHTEQLRLGGLVVSIDELVVTAAARGGGVGAALVARAKKAARELGAVRLELHTRRTRESYMRGFYVKNGFVEVDSALLRWDLCAENHA